MILNPIAIATGGYVPNNYPLAIASDGYIDLDGDGPPPDVTKSYGYLEPRLKKKKYDDDEVVLACIKAFMNEVLN